MPVFEPTDGKAITSRLEAGALLVACLCSLRCPKCEQCWPEFLAESEARREMCFVWVDVDDNADLVAEFADLSRLPLLLVQREEDVLFLGAITPERSAMAKAIETAKPKTPLEDPHLYEFLLSG